MAFTDLEPVDRRATATIIAETIRARIMDGTFDGGMQLTESQLAEALGVSRGPVREAFQRLAQEGLLRAEPHRGVFVAELGPDDAVDVAVARRAIERAAAERIAESRPTAVLASLGEQVEAMAAAADAGRWAEVAEADLCFHETLVVGAGSARLARMYATLLVETRLCLRTLPAEHPDPADVVAEHRALLDALAAGDVETAVAGIGAHLASQIEPEPA